MKFCYTHSLEPAIVICPRGYIQQLTETDTETHSQILDRVVGKSWGRIEAEKIGSLQED